MRFSIIATFPPTRGYSANAIPSGERKIGKTIALASRPARRIRIEEIALAGATAEP